MYNQPQISEIIFPENSPKSTILKHILQSSSKDFSYEAGNEFPAGLPGPSATRHNSQVPNYYEYIKTQKLQYK